MIIILEDNQDSIVPTNQRAQAHQKSFNSIIEKKLMIENKIDEIWDPIDDIADKAKVDRSWIFKILDNPDYSDFLSQHSKFEKFPAKEGNLREQRICDKEAVAYIFSISK